MTNKCAFVTFDKEDLKFVRALYAGARLCNKINYYMKYFSNVKHYESVCVGYVAIKNDVIDRVFDNNVTKAEMYMENELTALANRQCEEMVCECSDVEVCKECLEIERKISVCSNLVDAYRKLFTIDEDMYIAEIREIGDTLVGIVQKCGDDQLIDECEELANLDDEEDIAVVFDCLDRILTSIHCVINDLLGSI